MLKFQHASRASQGARPYQEDAAVVWPGDGLLAPSGGTPPEGTSLLAVLADGMGGHAGGALASATICSMFVQHFAGGRGDGMARLSPALLAANEAVGAKVRDNPGLAGMGATVVGAVIGAAGLGWISVGDSPMFLFRRGELVQLNEDHSLAPVIDRLAAQGKMSVAEARSDPRRHYLRSAVTGEELDLIDAPERPLQLAANDIVLIASDGIHTLDNATIQGLIAAHAASGPETIAERIIRAVDGAGEPHQDNTTVVVVTVSE